MSGQYFDASPGSSDHRRELTATIFGHTLAFTTSSGTFSPDHLDHATRVLLDTVPPPSGEPTLLDLGCGWGPIAVGLAYAVPSARVWAVDVNERARELTALNAKRNRASVHVCAPESVPGEVTFDQIWSNPPIRIGKDALHALLALWMPRLKPGGSAYLVVGRNLGADSLQRWLIDAGWPTERIASSRGFRILQVTRATG